MKSFIKKVFLLFTLTFVVMLALAGFDYWVIGGQYQQGYEASLIDKVHRLKSINESKIILVGNSNLAFGIHSEQIEEHIGMPVVNLGLHGGLGNAFHEEIAKLNINAGDIVVVCHTELSDNDSLTGGELAWLAYDYNREIWPIIRKKDYFYMLCVYPSYLRKSYALWASNEGNIGSTKSSYTRSAFNEYGDILFKPERSQMDTQEFFRNHNICVPEINDICTNRLNKLNQFCSDRGAVMVVAAYPIAYGEFAEFDEADFRTFQAELDAKLDCDIISDYTDYFFPYHYFYDTAYHLNEEGTNARTRQLIEDLENWLRNR